MAAVASTRNAQNSPRLHSKMTSPKDPKKKPLPEQGQRKDSPVTRSREIPPTSPTQSDSPNTSTQSQDPKPVEVTNVATTNAQPLAPPPKPSQPGASEGGGDYFNTLHSTVHFNLEPNPFEQSFGNNSSETPGKTLLPSVASLTSPSSLLPGGTPNWNNSLRSGPLSPAMLTGPTGSTDYFGDSHFRGGFPTPNESSLRTGLTPGGGGSMFPAQSPNSQAFLNLLQSGGATPSTLDFQRTAMSAAAKASQNIPNQANSNQTTQIAGTGDPKASTEQSQQGRLLNQTDSYHDANDAANGLFMLAQANSARNNNNSSGVKINTASNTKNNTTGNQFAVPGQPAQAIKTSAANSIGTQSQETSPVSQRGARASIASAGQGETGGDMSDSGHSEQTKPATRSRGKKAGNARSQTGGRRKAEESPAKTPASKKPKTQALSIPDMDEFSDDDEDVSPKLEHMDGNRKMTDEEKRKNFLERNRVAALKCRQRKKQWLQSLQAKVEYYSTENEALNQQVTTLREEILNLKTLIIAHKDCPITQQQGLSGMALANLLGDFPAPHGHPYGIAMQGGMQNGLPPQGFSMAPAPPAPMHRS